jgi:hypothetical protein
MRIIRGGLILKHLGGKDYLAKDEGQVGSVGIKVKEIPLTLTKKVMMQIIKEYGGKYSPKDKKKDLEFKLNTLYSFHKR